MVKQPSGPSDPDQQNRGDGVAQPSHSDDTPPQEIISGEAATLNFSPPADLAAGAKVRYFGDYELLKEIARGGMGVVYKARQTSLNRIVALKMILAGQWADEDDISRFQIEAESAAQLDHPGIVPVFEVGQHDGQHYFSMGFVDGESLAAKASKGPLEPRLAASLVATVAEAVEYAHRKGVIHRDLKPENVLLDREGNPRITDFGLAKRVAAAGGLTVTGQILGTPGYMPPEQAAGKMEEVGPAADVYALGAILYRLLVGRAPFQAASPLETLRQVLQQEPVAPRRLDARIPRDLETIALKCLEKRRQARYHTARELAAELRRHLAGEPIRARAANRLTRAVKWARRRPISAALLAVSVAATLILLVGGWRFQLERHARIQQKLVADGQTMLARQRLWHTLYEQARQKRLSHDRSESLALIRQARALNDTSELRREAVQTLLSPGVRLVRQIPVGHVFSMKFSGDGNLLAIHGKFGYGPQWSPADGERESWEKGDTDRLTIYRTASDQPLGEMALRSSGANFGIGASGLNPSIYTQHAPFALSPRGGFVALASPQQDHLRLWDAARQQDIGKPVSWSGGPFAFSPDGSTLAVAQSTGDKNVILLHDVAAGTSKTLELGPSRDRAGVIAFLGPGELLVQRGWPRLVRLNTTTGQEYAAVPEGMVPLALSADARWAALCTSPAAADGELTIWDLTQNRAAAHVPGAVPANLEPFGLQFSSDGRRLAFDSPARPGTFDIWDRVTGQTTTGFSGQVYGDGNWNLFQRGAFSPNARLLVSYSQKNIDVLCLWDVDRRQKLLTLRDQHSPVWSGDGRFLATIAPGEATRPDGSQYGYDRTFVTVWEVAYPTPFVMTGKPVDAITIHPDSARLAANGTLWDIETGPGSPWLRALAGQPDGVAAAYLPDGSLWVADFPTSPSEIKVKPFRLSQMGPGNRELLLQPPPVPPHRFRDRSQAFLVPWRNKLVLDCGGRWAGAIWAVWYPAAAGGGSQGASELCLVLWNLATGEGHIVTEWSGDSPCLAVSADGELLASGNDGIQIWDTRTRRALNRLDHAIVTSERLTGWKRKEGAEGAAVRYVFQVRCVSFSPDGERVFSGDEHGRVNVGDPRTGVELRSWLAHRGPVSALAISADGRLVASGGEDRTIRLWQAATGVELAQWEAHDEEVTALAFSHDGATLASGGADGTLRLWNLATIRQGLADLGFDW